MIRYVTGDATQPVGEGLKVIAHICNNEGKWGAGFVLALSKRWMKPERMYRHLFYAKHPDVRRPELGDIQVVRVEPEIFVCNMVAQNGLPSKINPHPLSYDALQVCLTRLTFRLERSVSKISIHAPKVGTGYGRGNWSIVEKIIATTVGERFDVTIYELEGE